MSNLKQFIEAVKETAGITSPTVTRAENGIQFTKRCAITKEFYTVTISVEQFMRVTKGEEHIQHIFPHLSKEQREFILSGTTPEEWDDMFKEEE